METTPTNNGCLPVNLVNLDIKTTQRTFALQVQSDSMNGRHILEGDLVLLEHGIPARHGDVVAVFRNNQQILRTAIIDKGKLWLRAENPNYPRFTQADGLVVLGVMTMLIRKMK